MRGQQAAGPGSDGGERGTQQKLVRHKRGEDGEHAVL